MSGIKRLGFGAGGGKPAFALCLVALSLTLAGCTSSGGVGGGQPDQAVAPPPSAPPPALTPPPIDLAGKWRLSVTGSSVCTVTFSGSTGASDGAIAPAGGCPGSFFTSRKWSYENNKLVIRNHKGDVLAQLAFTSGHFEGPAAGGTVILAH